MGLRLRTPRSPARYATPRPTFADQPKTCRLRARPRSPGRMHRPRPRKTHQIAPGLTISGRLVPWVGPRPVRRSTPVLRSFVASWPRGLVARRLRGLVASLPAPPDRMIQGMRLRVWIVDITGPPGTTLCRLGGPGVDGFIRPRQHVHFPC